ncbi:MAG: hypothetical protein A2Z25_10165 [Planctomycetes bacterium RBG_16_55_9]|nr:MAG: hypothetical protein A2Z25_10165 [Planctomycetes bacterium RBG_16_55_9]
MYRSSQAITTVLRATTEPTDKSIPPEIITSVIPNAATPTMVVWRAIISVFRAVAKLDGAMSTNKPNTAKRANTGLIVLTQPRQLLKN